MGRAFSMSEMLKNFSQKARREERYQRLRLLWEENIKMYFEGTGCEDVNRLRCSGILLWAW
jgi:hypothetical protein